ncbi:MAG: AraC family transcriptional regulator [Proteobacteria bacterium]|nr:AraC family transcriptional regulator [Pseudomonadota bacterium]
MSLRALSAHIGVSENYVSETLNKHLGVNFFEFVNRRRIEDACTLLRASEASALTIAYEVGFNSRSTFHAAFKKYVGASPHAFRKQSPQPEGESAQS